MSYCCTFIPQLRLTVVMITHDLDTLFRTCSRVGVIVDGRMITDTLRRPAAESESVDTEYFHGPRARAAEVEGKRMDRDANYVAVGAFVLLVIAMAVSFVFWYTDQQDKRSYERYEIYFPGTVSGLTRRQPGALPRRRRRQGGAHHDRSATAQARAGASPTSIPRRPSTTAPALP